MPSSLTNQRLIQITESIRTLGVDSITVNWQKETKVWRCVITWASPEKQFTVSKVGFDQISAMLEAGQEIERQLHDEFPTWDWPIIVWT